MKRELGLKEKGLGLLDKGGMKIKKKGDLVGKVEKVLRGYMGVGDCMGKGYLGCM